MVMGSIFQDFANDTNPDKEEDQPQQPPPQDPLAQQPAPSYADMAQGASNIANTFAPPQPPTTGQDFIDAPTGSPRAQLEQERQGQSQYGYAGQALATALPMVAFGAPAAAAGLGIQAATQAAGLPQPAQDVASLLPFTEGGLVQRGLQAGLGGLGAYGGQQADQALNLPQIPGLGGIGTLAGGIGGIGVAGALERGLSRPVSDPMAAQPEAPQPQTFTNAQPSISGTGYPTPEELAFGVQPTAESTGMRAVEPNNVPVGQPLSQTPVEELQRRLDAAQGVIDNTQREADRLIFHEGLSHNDPEVLAANQHITAAEDVWTQLNNELAQRGAYQSQPTTTTAPTSTTTTSGQPNEPEFRSDFNIQPEQLSALGKSIADHQKVISDMAVNAGITEDQARQMLANADMSSIRTRGASAREDYEETIGNLMRQDGLTREQAERVYMRPASFENGTNGPTGTTNTSGAYPPRDQFAGGPNYWDTTGIGPKIEAEQQRGPYIQWINENIAPEEQRVYKAALADVLAGKQAQAPTPEGTLGPDPATNPYRIAHDSIRQNLAPDMPYLPAPPPGSGATETPFRAYPGAPREAAPAGEPPIPAINPAPRFWENTTQFPDYKTGQSPFRNPEDGLIAEGHDGNIHNITGFLGVRDGQQWFQTETGEVPLSLLKNLSAADRAELGRMRTAAGGMPPNTPNAAPPSGPNAPGAQSFQQSSAGQQFAGQGAAGMNVTQPGASSSNAAPSTTYGGGAGGITGQAPPAGRPPGGGGAGPSSVPPRPASVPPTLWTHVADLITAPLKVTMAGFHFFRTGIEGLVHPTNLGNAFRGLGLSITDPVAGATFEKNLRESQPYVAQKLPPGSAIAGRQVQDFQPTPAPLRQGFITQFVNKIPYIGDLLKNTADGNGRFLRILRDSNYNDAAKFISQTVPTADTKFYQDTYDFLNHATGHSTIPGLRGGGVGTTYGAGVQAIAARLQTDVDMFTKSGSPLPWDAGARAEAVKYWMALGGVITATNALGSALGGSLNLPFNLGSIKAANIINPEGAVASNLFKVTTTNAEKTAKTEYGNDVGQSTMLRYLGGMGLAIYHGDTDAMKSLTTSFMRGEAGPIPGWGLDMLLGTEWRNGSIVPYGPKGGAQGMSNLMDDLHTGFISRWANIGVKNLVDSMNAYGPVSGLIRGLPALGAGEVNTSPINTTSQAFKYSAPADALQQAFTGPQTPLTTILQNKDWNELFPTEKSALTKTLSPAVIDQINQASYQRNPAITQHSETLSYLGDKKTAIENELLDRYNAGQLDKAHVVDYMKAAQKDYYSMKDKLDADPAYKAEVAKIPPSQSGAQAALDTFYQIPDKAGREAYLQHVTQADPELGTRLRIATQPQNQSKLELMYANGELR